MKSQHNKDSMWSLLPPPPFLLRNNYFDEFKLCRKVLKGIIPGIKSNHSFLGIHSSCSLDLIVFPLIEFIYWEKYNI